MGQVLDLAIQSLMQTVQNEWAQFGITISNLRSKQMGQRSDERRRDCGDVMSKAICVDNYYCLSGEKSWRSSGVVGGSGTRVQRFKRLSKSLVTLTKSVIE